MTTITLKPASDVPRRAFVNALNDAYADYFVPIYVSKPFLREMATREALRLEHSVAAVSGRDVVGTGLLGVSQGRGWVGGMGVVPAFRRKGIGRHMMQYLIQRATDLDLTALQLEVIDENTPAIALYESLGFVTQRTLYVMVCEGHSTPSPPTHYERLTGRGPIDPALFEGLSQVTLPWQRGSHVMAFYGRQLRTLALRDGDAITAACAYVIQGGTINLMQAAAADEKSGLALFGALFDLHTTYRATFLNVSGDDPLLPVLQRVGFSAGVTQYEMTLTIE